jgi:signal peptidase I
MSGMPRRCNHFPVMIAFRCEMMLKLCHDCPINQLWGLVRRPDGSTGRNTEEVVRMRIRGAAREYLEAILVALILALVLRTFVVQAYRIPSDSMEKTLEIGDFILVSKFTYHFREPRPNDVLVFK